MNRVRTIERPTDSGALITWICGCFGRQNDSSFERLFSGNNRSFILRSDIIHEIDRIIVEDERQSLARRGLEGPKRFESKLEITV